jgi:SAM-dependent methyltransferase
MIDLQSIYYEVKRLAFAKGYWIVSPLSASDTSIEFSALIICNYIGKTKIEIFQNGSTIKYTKLKSDMFTQICDRLDLPREDSIQVSFSCVLDDHHSTILKCIDSETGNLLGNGFYLPSTDILSKANDVPLHGMVRSTRLSDKMSFTLSGYHDYETLNKTCRSFAAEITSNSAMKLLDWGVGAGRISQFFEKNQSYDVYGTDIDPVNISNLHNSGLRKNRYTHMQPKKPIPFPDSFFDVVYGISVFTHLTEALQFYYLNDIARILKPGGIGIFSVHGLIHFFTRVNDGNQFSQWFQTGFYQYSVNKDLIDGFPETVDEELYVDVFHSVNYLFSRWGQVFKEVKLIESPNSYGHDLVVVKKM